MTLFAALERSMQVQGDPMSRWSGTLKFPLEIVSIPGDHMTLLVPPQLEVVVREIKARLPRG